MIPVETNVGEYRGYPMLEFNYRTRNGVHQKLSFGVTKAMIILENLDTIRRFIEENKDFSLKKANAKAAGSSPTPSVESPSNDLLKGEVF